MTLEAEVDFPVPVAAPVEDDQLVEAAQLFRRHGTVLLRNCFDPDLIGSLRESFTERYGSRSPDQVAEDCLEVGDLRYMFTVRVEPPFGDPDLYAAPRLLPVMQAVLGADCVLQSLGAVCAYPGSGTQHVHRDTPLLFPEAGELNGILPPHAVTAVVPLVDLDASTGTTALWPGSHRSVGIGDGSTEPEVEGELPDGAVLPWPRAGDCYLMDYRLCHAGTPNRSDRPRPILYVVFSRGWYVDHVNYEKQARLVIAPGELERVPGRLRPLFEKALVDGS